MINIEIWASGGGTNADAILHYFTNHKTIQIASLGCNRKKAGAFSVALSHDVPSVYWSHLSWNSTTILGQLKEREIDFIVLAGFLKLVPSEVIAQYKGKIVNIHPSLLPKYGGDGMYGDNVHRAVLQNNESATGITIHEVNEEYDKGKILAQYTTSLEVSDDIDGVKKKIQLLEHTHFAPTIESWVLAKTRVL